MKEDIREVEEKGIGEEKEGIEKERKWKDRLKRGTKVKERESEGMMESTDRKRRGERESKKEGKGERERGNREGEKLEG